MLLGGSVLLSGCITIPNRTGLNRLSPAAFSATNTGVVVLSYGAPGRCLTKSTVLTVHDQASGRGVKPEIQLFVDAVNMHKSDFAEHYGAVSAFQLAPGTYFLHPAVLALNVSVSKSPTFVFDVRAGETTYAGELFMTRSCGYQNAFVIRDQYDRDIALAREKNPAIEGRPVVKRLLRPGADVNY
jgi:hypothetical protein